MIAHDFSNKTKKSPYPSFSKLSFETKFKEAEFIQYGPLNLADENYWVKAAKQWRTTPEVAKKSNCSNCVAFDISSRMEKCMPGAIDGDGILGYCWMHHFKCHSARTCYTWAAGGPIDKDEASYDWQKRNLKGALSTEPI